MANMSYCRFRNTHSDLIDCIHALREMVENEKKDLSVSEELALQLLKADCATFVELCDELDEIEE